MRWWRRKQREQDLERELYSHLELEAEEQREAGLSPEESNYAAKRAFGNTTLMKEEVRKMWEWTVIEQIWQDLRLAMRTLRKSSGFTIATVLTLALGISANSAIFSIVNGVLLKPLPFEHSDQLVEVFVRDAQGHRELVSQPDLDDWRTMTHSFNGMASWAGQSVNLTGLERPERLAAEVPRKNADVVVQFTDQFDQPPHRRLVHVHVHVADMQDGEPVEARR